METETDKPSARASSSKGSAPTTDKPTHVLYDPRDAVSVITPEKGRPLVRTLSARAVAQHVKVDPKLCTESLKLLKLRPGDRVCTMGILRTYNWEKGELERKPHVSECVRVSDHWSDKAMGGEGGVNVRTFMRALANVSAPKFVHIRRDGDPDADLGTLTLRDC